MKESRYVAGTTVHASLEAGRSLIFEGGSTVIDTHHAEQSDLLVEPDDSDLHDHIAETALRVEFVN